MCKYVLLNKVVQKTAVGGKHHNFPVPVFENEPGKLNIFFLNSGTKLLFPKIWSRIPGKPRNYASLSLCLSFYLLFNRSFVHSFACLVFLSFFCSFFLSFILSLLHSFFFFSSWIVSIFLKVWHFLAPKIRDENGNFFWFPKIDGEKCSGAVLPRISGTAETWRKNYDA